MTLKFTYFTASKVPDEMGIKLKVYCHTLTGYEGDVPSYVHYLSNPQEAWLGQRPTSGPNDSETQSSSVPLTTL